MKSSIGRSVATLALSMALAVPLGAQDPDLVCIPHVSGVNFETNAEWRVDAPGDRCVQLRISQLDLGLRQAEIAINQYIDRSIHDVERGHVEGFAQFRDWYRARLHQREEEQATADLLKHLIGTVLKGGLNVIFPESGEFMDKLREYASKAYETAADNIGRFDPGDVNQFLDRHQSVLQSQISNLTKARDDFIRDAGAVLDAAKWEFLLANGNTTSAELGQELRRMLRDAGIPEPGTETIRVYKERVLTRQIQGILETEDCGLLGPCKNMYPGNVGTVAEATALRFLEPTNLDRFCAVEQRLADLWRSPDCHQWRASH